MNQNDGVAASPPLSGPSDLSPASGSSRSAIANAEIGRRCADSLEPQDFAPLVRRAADDFYERLMEGVQDHLCANVEWNITERIDAAQRDARLAREEADILRRTLAEVSEALEEVVRKFDAAPDAVKNVPLGIMKARRALILARAEAA